MPKLPRSHQLGDAPIEPAYYEQMRATAAALDEIFNGPAKGHDRQTGRDSVRQFEQQVKRGLALVPAA